MALALPVSSLTFAVHTGDTGMPVREGQCWSPELGDSQSDTRELTQARALPNRPPTNRVASRGSSKSSDVMSMALLGWESLKYTQRCLRLWPPSWDLSKPSRLQSGGPHIPFPTSVPSAPFALGPAPDPGNILSFPELNPLLQLPSEIGILNKCFLSQDHLISSSSPRAGVQEPKAALLSF